VVLAGFCPQVRLEDFEGALGSYTTAADLAPGISGKHDAPDLLSTLIGDGTSSSLCKKAERGW